MTIYTADTATATYQWSSTAAAVAPTTWTFCTRATPRFANLNTRISKERIEKPKMRVSELIELWEGDYKMIKVGEEKDSEGNLWLLYECHLPYFSGDYGRHACLRIKSRRGRVLDYRAFNISRRTGEDPSGIPIVPRGGRIDDNF